MNVTAQGADGAAIDIDDKTAGITTPPSVQSAPIPLGWGPHHVRVKKDGFLTFEKDVQIDEGQSTTLVVTLIPSPDFIDAYKGRNSKLRIGAYATGVIAIAAGVFALEQNNENSQLYRAYSAYRHLPGARPPAPRPGQPHPRLLQRRRRLLGMERLTGTPPATASDCARRPTRRRTTTARRSSPASTW